MSIDWEFSLDATKFLFDEFTEFFTDEVAEFFTDEFFTYEFFDD